jgi:hypothetical protein
MWPEEPPHARSWLTDLKHEISQPRSYMQHRAPVTHGMPALGGLKIYVYHIFWNKKRHALGTWNVRGRRRRRYYGTRDKRLVRWGNCGCGMEESVVDRQQHSTAEQSRASEAKQREGKGREVKGSEGKGKGLFIWWI